MKGFLCFLLACACILPECANAGAHDDHMNHVRRHLSNVFSTLSNAEVDHLARTLQSGGYPYSVHVSPPPGMNLSEAVHMGTNIPSSQTAASMTARRLKRSVVWTSVTCEYYNDDFSWNCPIVLKPGETKEDAGNHCDQCCSNASGCTVTES